MAVATSQPFSLEVFQTLFQNSRARKYLSNPEVQQVYSALEAGNIKLLKLLYRILLKEKVQDEEIVRDFVMAKNQIVDEFNLKATGIAKRSILEPKKQREAWEKAHEKALADELIEDL